MATVIDNNNPTPNRTVVIDSGESSMAGWAIAIIILLAVIAGGAYWYMHRAPANSGNSGATIQVNLPGAGYAPADNSQTAPAGSGAPAGAAQ